MTGIPVATHVSGHWYPNPAQLWPIFGVQTMNINNVASYVVTALTGFGAAFGFLDALIFQADPARRMGALFLALMCLLVLFLNHIDDKRQEVEDRRKGAYKARHGL